MICSYGCGREARFLIGALQKPCCEEKFYLCPYYRSKASERQPGENNSFYNKKHSNETKEKFSIDRRGDGNSFFGKQHSDESKNKISHSRKGKCLGDKNPSFGKIKSDETIEKISKTRIEREVAKGSKNPNWRGGITNSRKNIMTTTEYKRWRKAVFERDSYKCIKCGKGGLLNAHHKKPVAFYPELIFELDNGMTLCIDCHKETYKEIGIIRKSFE